MAFNRSASCPVVHREPIVLAPLTLLLLAGWRETFPCGGIEKAVQLHKKYRTNLDPSQSSTRPQGRSTKNPPAGWDTCGRVSVRRTSPKRSRFLRYVDHLQRNHLRRRLRLRAPPIVRLDFRAFPRIARRVHAHHFVFGENAAGEAVLAAVHARLAVGAP